MVLNGLIDDPEARFPVGVDQQIGVRQGAAGVFDSEKWEEFRARPHGDQISACRNPIAKHRRLIREGAHVAEYNHVVSRQDGGRDLRQVNGVETIKALGAQYFLVILGELISRAGDHQDRRTRLRCK